MSASSNPGGKGGYGGPNTAGPGGQGRDYNGNAIGSRWPGQFTVGGPAPRIGFGPAPIPGAPPAPGDLYRPGVPQPQPAVMPPQGGNRFMPGGMIPPAGSRLQPGQPTVPYTRQRPPAGDPARYGQPNPGDIFKGIVNPIFDGIGRGIGGGGKGGFPGGQPVGGPAPLPQPPQYGEYGPFGGTPGYNPNYGGAGNVSDLDRFNDERNLV